MEWTFIEGLFITQSFWVITDEYFIESFIN